MATHGTIGTATTTVARRARARSCAGQIAIEFSFMLMLAFLLFAVVLILVSVYLTHISQQREQAALQDEAGSLQQELLLASTVQDGYRRTITLPETLDGHAYAITYDDPYLTLTFTDGTAYTVRIPPIAGTFATGSNTLHRSGATVIITQP